MLYGKDNSWYVFKVDKTKKQHWKNSYLPLSGHSSFRGKESREELISLGNENK